MDLSEADHAVVFNTLYTALQCVCGWGEGCVWGGGVCVWGGRGVCVWGGGGGRRGSIDNAVLFVCSKLVGERNWYTAGL